MRGSHLWKTVFLGIVGLFGAAVVFATPQAEPNQRSISADEFAAFLKSGESLDNLIEAFDIPPGGSVVIEFEVTVDNPPSMGATQISNQGTVTGTGLSEPTDDPDTPADDDPTITGLIVDGDLAVTKTDGVTTAVPGQSLVYTIVASNAGPLAVPDAALVDTFPTGFLCTWTSVAAGGATGNTDNGIPAASLNESLSLPASAMVTYTVTCSIPADATGTISNTASISSATVNDPDLGDNMATDGDTVLTPQADLGITKTDSVTSAIPGNQVVYTIVASNAGPSDDPTVSVTDTFPADLACGWTSVAAGGATGNTDNPGPANLSDTLDMPTGSSVTYTVTCDIDPAATGTLSNTATVSGSATDNNNTNDSATDDDTALTPQVDISVSKDDGVTSAIPGTQVVYTIVASNSGPSTDPTVAVTDTFPAELSCGWTSVAAGGATGNTNNPGPADLNDTLNMPPSSSVTYTATCDIDPAATGTLLNTATVSSSVTDTDSGNDSATDNNTVLTPQADIAVTKTDGVTTAAPGTQLIYTIVATNNGPSTDPTVAVMDTFPATLTCGWTSVAAGGATGNTNNPGPANLNDTLSMPPSSSVTYTATCDIPPTATGTLSNTATVNGSVTDNTPGNDSATDDDTELVPSADLTITKDDGVTTVPAGDPLVYTIVASNDGPSEVTADVDDTFPVELTGCSWTSVAAGGATGNSNDSGAALADTLTLPPGSSVTYTVTCTVDLGAVGTTLSNTATISSTADDPNPGDESATDDDTEVGPPGDMEPPNVTEVNSATHGTLTECQTLLRSLGELQVVFDDTDLRTGGGADAADNPANYELRSTGPDGMFGTGDDVLAAFSSATFLGDTTTLNAVAAPSGFYRFTARSTILDLAGNALGDGTDFVLEFRLDLGNLLDNGHFDCDLGSWTEEPPAAPEVSHSSVDQGNSPQSGSVEVANSTGTAFTLGQCVGIDLTSRFQANPFRIGAQVRLDAAGAVQVGTNATCRFFDQAACGGNDLGGASALPIDILSDTAGQFLARANEFDVPVGALSALCSFEWVSPGGEIWTAYGDIFFLNSEGPTFTDGFESGDTSAWSLTQD